MSTATPATTTAEPASVSEATLRAALSTRTRPPAPSPLGASVSFGWRAMLKIKHVPMQLFDVTMFPIMFTLLFTYLFGGALAGSPQEYIQVLLPGILVMTVVMITMYTGMALNTDISKGVFDRFRSLPIWRPAVLVGMMLADAVRYTMAALVVTALGVIIGFRPDGGVMGVAAAIGAAAGVLVQPVVGVERHRHEDADARDRHADEHDGPVPADLRVATCSSTRRPCRAGCRRS